MTVFQHIELSHECRRPKSCRHTHPMSRRPGRWTMDVSGVLTIAIVIIIIIIIISLFRGFYSTYRNHLLTHFKILDSHQSLVWLFLA